MELPAGEALDTALYFIDDADAAASGSRAQGVHMLSTLLERLSSGSDETIAIALRPRIIAALNAVTAELSSQTAAAEAVRSSKMAGALLMHKTLFPSSPALAQAVPAAAKRPVTELGTGLSLGPQPALDARAHQVAARKTVRALAEMCLRQPQGMGSDWALITTSLAPTHEALLPDSRVLLQQGALDDRYCHFSLCLCNSQFVYVSLIYALRWAASSGVARHLLSSRLGKLVGGTVDPDSPEHASGPAGMFDE